MPWSQNYRTNGTDVVKHTFSWVSDGSGNASVASGLPVSGAIERVVFIPSASAAPSALYDVTLLDENGIDVLSGRGADRAASGNVALCPGTPMSDGTTTSTTKVVVDGILTLNVANAGASKAGSVVVYVR